MLYIIIMYSWSDVYQVNVIGNWFGTNVPTDGPFPMLKSSDKIVIPI